MSLQIRRKSPFRLNSIATLMAVFALVVSPMYGVVSERVASASTSSLEITKVEPYFRAADKHIRAEVGVKGYDDLFELKVQLLRDDKSEIASVEASQTLLEDINSNNGVEQTRSTVFQLPKNTRNSGSWVYDDSTFTRNDVPKIMRVTAVDSSGTDTMDVTLTDSHLKNSGQTYQSVLPGPVYRTEADGATPQKHFDTIQEALNDADTGDGSKVVVTGGTYNENIELKRKVTLVGDGATINGGSARYTVFINKSAISGSEISGFTLKGSTNAVLKIGTNQNLSNLNIHSNTFDSSSSHLIAAGNLSNSQIVNNNFVLKNGVKAMNSDGPNVGLHINNNKFSGNTDVAVLTVKQGSYSEFNNNKFLNNGITANDKIIELEGDNNEATGNTYVDNMVAIEDSNRSFQGVYRTINGAVGASQDGYVLTASAGTYSEAVNINKSVMINGAQAGVDARDRSGVNESILDGSFKVKTKSATIDGFTVSGVNGGNNNRGIDATGFDIESVKVLNNIISGGDSSQFGIASLNNNADVLIARNKISGYTYPAYVDSNRDYMMMVSFQENDLHGKHLGLEQVIDLKLENNNFNDGLRIQIQPSVNATVFKNNNFNDGSYIQFKNYSKAEPIFLNLVAGSNWWGQITGPEGDQVRIVKDNPNGSTSSYTVATDPWLCQPFSSDNSNTSDGGTCDPSPSTSVSVNDFNALSSDLKSQVFGKKLIISGTAVAPKGAKTAYVKLNSKSTGSNIGGTRQYSFNGEIAATDWQMTYDDLVSGEYRIMVTFKDNAGKSVGTGWSQYFTVDSTAPSILNVKLNGNVPSSPQPTANGQVYDINALDVVGGEVTVTADITDSGSGVAKAYNAKLMRLKASGHTDGTAKNMTIARNGDTWTFTVDTSGGAIKGGTYQVFFNAIDKVGNVSAQRINVYIDNAAPEVSLGSIEAVVSGESIQVRGSVEDTNLGPEPKVEIFVDGESEGIAEVDGDGNFEMTIPGLAVGRHTVRAEAVDMAGNRGVSGEVDAIVSPTAPNIESATEFGASGTANPGATVAVKDNLGNVLGETEANEEGQWGLMFDQALAAGSTTILVATATMNGQSSSDSEEFLVTVPEEPQRRPGPAATTTTNATSGDDDEREEGGFPAVILGEPGMILGDNVDTEPGDSDNTDTTTGRTDGERRGDVAGAADDKDGCYKLLGLCWYYWIPIVIVVAAIIVWRSLARREEPGVA